MIKKLTSICNPKQWKTLAAKQLLTEGYPVYGANGIIGFWPEYNHTTDTIAIGCRGTCGTVNMALGYSYINGNAMCIDELSEEIDIWYLYYYLQYFDFDKIISGSTIPQITRQGLEKIEVDVCSQDKQKEIAFYLRKVDSIIDYTHKQLTKLDELVKTRFVELFGSVKNNHQGYCVVKIGSCAKLQGGFGFKSSDYLDDGIRLVQISNVNKDTLDWDSTNCVPLAYLEKYKDFELHVGDLVLAMTRPVIKSLEAVKIATVSENDIPSLLNQRVGRFVIDKAKLNTIYLMLSCQMPEFREYVEAMSGNSLQPNISSKQVEDYSIILPPLPLQEQFAAFFEQTEKIKMGIQKSLEQFKVLKKSLMKKYFG